MEKKRVSMSFVARIWLEPETIGDMVWRGHVRHVQSNDDAYFQDLGSMSQFLARVSGVAGPSLTAQPLKDATKSESGTVKTMKRKD
tara:strand:- start:777 stop:1034 length:258 start_codon:yes stop_codon:yes gene_type:complete